MDEDELLDSELLEKTILGLINQGKRNFSIDLSGLDYLYSDSMNKLLGLNRKVLDVNGRLSLLGPTDEVRKIIERAGIHNFIKVYSDEGELERSAEEIIKQTTSFSLSDIQRLRDQVGGQPQEKPESEFEELRSELGGAFSFGEGDEGAASRGPRQAPPPQQKQAPGAQPPRPFGYADSGPTSPPEGYRQPGSSSSYQHPGSPPQQHGAPPPPQPPRAAPPPRPQPPSSSQHQAPQAPSYRPSEPAPAERKPSGVQEPKAGRVDRDLFDEEKKKKSPVGTILVLLLALAALGAGGWYAYIKYIEPSMSQPEATVAEEPAEPAVPQLTVEQDSTAEDTVAQAEEEVEEEEEEKPAKVASTRSSRPSRPKPAPRRTTPRRTVTRPKPSPPPPPKVSNKLTITSSPPGATVSVDGKQRGTTPYTWDDPAVYGTIIVEVARAGYETEKRSMDYTGGTKSEHFTLNKEPERAPPPKPKPEPEPEPEPVVSTPPPPSSQPPASSQPVATTPAPSASSGGGSPGTIFIASIPPVADVYMDGKKIGQTNIAELKVTSGTHSMRFVKGGKEITKEMTFKAGKNPSQMVKIP